MERTVTDSNSKEFFAESLPIVLDFWATWCGPCRQIAPSLETLANEYEGKVIVGKCDVEESPDLAQQYGIRNVPTVLFIKNGEVVDKFVGSLSKSAIQEKFEKLI